jgi:5-methylcytosine-specific restriction protein B
MSEIFKALPSNITKEHLLQAIAKIDAEGIPKNSDSNYYDVVFNERKYPPKVILSFANLFANGELIDRRTFPGGLDTPCFNLLEKNDFKIIPKEIKLPFQIALYDISGASNIENYETLKSSDNSLLIWEDSKFKKLNKEDYVFWVNQAKQEALLTKVVSKNVIPSFNNGENTIEFNGFIGSAKAENPEKYKNFIGFEIIEKVEIDGIWDYTDTSTFSSQLMAINLLAVGTKLQELPKKIEKLEDLDRIFYESEKASEIIQNAIEILEEKAGGFLNRVLTNEEFRAYISQFDGEELHQYFNWLKYFLLQLNISIGDERLTYNYYNRSLILTIGQRYGFIYKPFDKEAKFFIMSNSSIGNLNKDQTFGGEPLCYFCRRNELNLSELEVNEVLKGMKVELARTERSRYRKYNKDNFERYILEVFEYKAKKTDLIPEIVAAIKSDFIQNAIKKEDFSFQKASDHFNYFKNLKEPSDGFYKALQKKYWDSNSTYLEFIKTLIIESEEYKLIRTIGKLISYIDVNAANKNELNEYDDNRTLAKTGVNQTFWLKYLLKFKVNSDYSTFPPTIKSALIYLEDPTKEITLFSENHREMVAINLLKQPSFNKDEFVNQFVAFFKPYGINPKNPLNNNRIISEILYLFPDVEKLWKKDTHKVKQNTNSISTDFQTKTNAAGLIFSQQLIKRYIASLATKPFIIFTGLSGSGKTKLAQTFAKWISIDDSQYSIIPVGADWTNREPLLGYPNGLDSKKYVLPDNGALNLIFNAIENAKDKGLSACSPYFLILDEMNLSHVERYFADFLSAMESQEPISLYSGGGRLDENNRLIPKEILLPKNLFIVGTVNIDETTYMFSPKVLDRANTIEFRVDKNDLETFFDAENNISQEAINGKGQLFTSEFMALVSNETVVNDTYHKDLLNFFEALQPVGAEFGYRTANEMNRLIYQLDVLGLEKDEKSLDVAVMQKLLPKLHGSRTKLNKVLPVLASFCIKDQKLETAKTFLEEKYREGQLKKENINQLTLPLSFAKIARMYCSAQENGFASYAEG